MQSLFFPWTLPHKAIFGCAPAKSRKFNKTMDNTQGKSQNMVTVQRSKNKFRLEQQDGEVWEVNLHEKKKVQYF